MFFDLLAFATTSRQRNLNAEEVEIAAHRKGGLHQDVAALVADPAVFAFLEEMEMKRRLEEATRRLV
jgi:hypothetical protein